MDQANEALINTNYYFHNSNRDKRCKNISIAIFCLYMIFFIFCVTTLGFMFKLTISEDNQDDQNNQNNYTLIWYVLLIETTFMITDMIAVFFVFKRKIIAIINRSYVEWHYNYIKIYIFKIAIFTIIPLIFGIRQIQFINTDHDYFQIVFFIQNIYQICFSIYFGICLFSLPKYSEEPIRNIYCNCV